MLYRDGANDGFHEAIGDTIALSITPESLIPLTQAQPWLVVGVAAVGGGDG
jgi:peptidyl-dipeptidase A